MNRQSIAFGLIASAAALMLGSIGYCATTDARTAPKGASLALFIGAVVLPASCLIGASQAMDA